MSVSAISDPNLLVVFTTAIAGFGHVRVTQALRSGLPDTIPSTTLGIADTVISEIHRLISTYPTARNIFEWAQQGRAEELFTAVFRWYLLHDTKSIYAQLEKVIAEHETPPKTMLVVATHFGLAHQISAIKEQLSIEKNLRILLVVQVTDDSPQFIWYVPGADLIVVPSDSTRESLLKYGKSHFLAPVTFKVLPYPVSALLSQTLTKSEFAQKESQVDMTKSPRVEMAIPISGAAVGLDFFQIYIDAFFTKNKRFHIHIISRESSYTRSFLQTVGAYRGVTLWTQEVDKKVVADYEAVYKQNIIALEVTKPSEQAFKALLSPTRRGGSLLLLTAPVGRQEYDNLHFLERHALLPRPSEHHSLWEKAKAGAHLEAQEHAWLFKKASNWRALRLPKEPLAAANFTHWCLEEGIFAAMMKCHVHASADDQHAHELASDGVAQFWQEVEELLLSSSGLTRGSI